MGIANIQKQRIIEESAKVYYAAGEKPRLIDILSDASKFFAEFLPGQPLKLDLDGIIDGYTSDVDALNEALSRLAFNVDVLYDASSAHVQKLMSLTTILRHKLLRLKARRLKALDQIDDYLFTLYNADGYYYSISDSFASLDLIDLALTSAFVNVESGRVEIPTISSLTKRVEPSKISGMKISATTDGVSTQFKPLGSMASAFDGLSNTYWGIEITTNAPADVVVNLNININNVEIDPVTLSRLDFEPYGMVPVQMFATIQPVDTTKSESNFGGAIKTSAYNMSFIDNAISAKSINITLRKTQADYTTNLASKIQYHYIFAAKNILLTEQVYDAGATLVTIPLELASDIVNEAVIDAVSLVASLDINSDTSVSFYVAADFGTSYPSIDDFDWQEIVPLEEGRANSHGIVSFGGSRTFITNIKENPGPSDLQLISLDSTNSDLTKRNPSAVIFSGLDIYRIAAFTEENVLLDSLLLEEGINTTKILYVDKDDDALDLVFWKDYVNGTNISSSVFGRIDSGYEFFYGGDIGEGNQSVYVETYLESDGKQGVLLKNVIKSDVTWDMKVFLNGREIANMPAGIKEIVAPWKFQEGRNHIALTINIPEGAYNGTVDLMGEDDIFDFGSVKLATWNYIDLFKMQHNEVGQPATFSLYNGEIISRRKPTTNLRLKYAKSTDNAPSGIRLRADLRRSNTNPNVSPLLNDYRLRFLYSNS